jgi:hypothetical protein
MLGTPKFRIKELKPCIYREAFKLLYLLSKTIGAVTITLSAV